MHIFKATSGRVWSHCNMGFAVCAVQPSVRAPNLSTWMCWQEFASQSRFIARPKLGIFYISRCLDHAKSWNRCVKTEQKQKCWKNYWDLHPPSKKKKKTLNSCVENTRDKHKDKSESKMFLIFAMSDVQQFSYLSVALLVSALSNTFWMTPDIFKHNYEYVKVNPAY